MAISFTPEQYGTIKTVADKMGSGNENFKSALNKKYGEGAYDSYLGYKAPVAPAPAAPIAPTPIAPVIPVAPVDNTGANTASQMNQTNLEVQRNAEQAAFNAANPVGTKVEDIKATAKADIKPIASVENPQAIATPKKSSNATTAQPMAVPGVDDMATLKLNADNNRKREILGNLDEGFKNDAEINKAITTGDYETYKTRYEYDTADENKKRTLDAYFQAKQPKDSEGIYNILKTGARIASQNIINSPDYAKAKAKADIFTKLAGMTSGQLLTEMKNGNIGTEMDRELTGDAEYAAAKQQYATYKTTQDVNKATQDALSVINNKPKKEDTTLQDMSDKATAGVPPEKLPSLQEYMKKQAPELTEKVSSFNQKNQLLREKSDQRDNMLRTVIKDHPGISKGAAMVLASRNNESLNDEIKSMSYDLQTMQADINYATEIVKADFENAQKQQESSQAFSRQKELAQFQQELSLKGDQAKFEQQMKQKAAIASDPVLATQDLIDTYAKMGILPSDSPQQLQEWVQREIKKGRTLGDVLGEMNKNFQRKDSYKAIQAKAQNDNVSFQKIGVNQDTGEDIMGWVNKTTQTATPYSGGGTTTFTGMDTDLRNSSYVQQYPNEASFKNNNPAGITWNANFDNGTGVAKALQEAGISFSKGTARPKSEGGNYVQFNNIGDGMKARQIVFGTTYGNKDLSQALQSWKEGSNRNAGTQQYADSIMKEAGINTNQSITYNSLSQEQKDALTLAQIKRESGGLYKVLTQTPTKQGPSTADQIFDTIFQNSGGASKVSGDESKVMKKRAREYAAQGISAQDALLKYKGLNLSKEVSPDIAQQYINIGDNLLEKKPNDFEGKVAKYLNAGDTNGLNTYVNGLADDKVKARYGNDSILSSTYKVGNDRTNKLVTLIENNKDKLGAFDGNVSNLLLKFKDMPEYQQLKTILTMSQADTRKYFAGSAVTATELSALEDFIGGKTTMNPANLVTMLKTIKEDRDNTYSSQRVGLTLPTDSTQETINTSTSSSTTPTWQQFY